MAGIDYILCTDCHTKVVYDGDHTSRDWLMERFGVDTLLCPKCALERAERARDLVMTCSMRWRLKMDKDFSESFKIISKLRRQIARLEKGK